ncbi:spore germination protein GerW family protein [Sporosarcina obsidiansis]|uniref:spore germination protein GerW family protein n=1 Tax=Sporosarcina obsidiansis TaxID=2660748 RepID=UPI001891DCE2|nr:spore germination protein GerW family protein [Sporosarcina obsidiansis]
MNNGQDQPNKKAVQNEYIETPVKTIFNKFANQKDVSLIYGEPIELGLQKVVPVAKVKYAVGGGGDGSGGEGGGGAFTIRPVGVYVITPDQVKFESTLDVKKLTELTVMVGGVLGLLALCKGK